VLCSCFPPRWHLALLLVGGSAYLDPPEDNGHSPRLALTLSCLCQLLVLALGLQVRGYSAVMFSYVALAPYLQGAAGKGLSTPCPVLPSTGPPLQVLAGALPSAPSEPCC